MDKKTKHIGRLVISLDFELFWGVRDKKTIQSYGESLKNVKEVVPRLLETFSRYNVKSTFATVGLLFAKDKSEMIDASPKLRPEYYDINLSPYKDNFELVNKYSKDDPYHYGIDLINLIKKYPGQEIGSHTFSHYYCMEEGQTAADFKADTEAAIAIAEKNNISIKSLVLPRNQWNHSYLGIIKDKGINNYRGNERIWFHNYQSEKETTLLKRIFRTANCYINIGGHHCYSFDELAGKPPYDIPSSRFLRPQTKKLSFLKFFQLRRIKKSMTYAAKKGLIYHIWWHPHNFSANMEENFMFLKKILEHYRELNLTYNFESNTMAEIGLELDNLKHTKP